MAETRVCKKCGREKNIDRFYKTKGEVRGTVYDMFSTKCKKCKRREYNKRPTGLAKLGDELVRELCTLRSEGKSYGQIAELTGYTRNNVCYWFTRYGEQIMERET